MVQMFMQDLKKVSALWSVRFRMSALERFYYKGSGPPMATPMPGVSRTLQKHTKSFYCTKLRSVEASDFL